jgi:hypothetical protein
MTSMAPKLRAERTQPGRRTVAPEDNEAQVARRIRGALDDYLGDRKLVKVKIRQLDGRSVDGFLKIEGRKGERLLVDFKAITTQQGELSSLEVAGRRISLDAGPSARRTH